MSLAISRRPGGKPHVMTNRLRSILRYYSLKGSMNLYGYYSIVRPVVKYPMIKNLKYSNFDQRISAAVCPCASPNPPRAGLHKKILQTGGFFSIIYLIFNFLRNIEKREYITLKLKKTRLLSVLLCLALLPSMFSAAVFADSEIWTEAPTGWTNPEQVIYQTATVDGKTYVLTGASGGNGRSF